MSAGLAVEVRPADVEHYHLERLAVGLRLLDLPVGNQCLVAIDGSIAAKTVEGSISSQSLFHVLISRMMSAYLV